MNIDPTRSVSPLPDRTAATSRSAASNPSNIADSAKQFEALMLGQILKASHDSSDGGWLGTGDDQGGEMAVEIAEQQFAQAMSAKGGFGFAKLITAGLEHGAAKAAKSGSPTSVQATTTNTDSQP